MTNEHFCANFLINASYRYICVSYCEQNKSQIFTGEKKILPKKATRNVTLAALLIEEVTKRLTLE